MMRVLIYWARFAGPAALLLAGALVPYGATAAITQAPSLSTPGNGETLATFSPALGWTSPAGTTQVQLQVTPFGGDGPGVNLIMDATQSFLVPAAPDWYGLLPDMGYTWRVRATDATMSVGEQDPGWGPWAQEFTFRTPKVNISSVAPFDPVDGKEVAGGNPVLRWSSSTPNLFYWEVQVSKDPQFGADSFLYWALVHGDVTYPANAYTVPSTFLLQAGATYSWRVRPRVQGDGTPLPWTASATFKTPAAGKVFLQLSGPQDESEVSSSSVTVAGKTTPGAIVSVEDQVVIAGSAGDFSVSLTLEQGINVIDVIASDLVTGDTVATSLTVTYIG